MTTENGPKIEDESDNNLKDEYEKLKAEEAEIDQKQNELVSRLSLYCDPFNLQQEKMKMLRKYNDQKDATQDLIGMLANYRGLSIKKVHSMLQLPMD